MNRPDAVDHNPTPGQAPGREGIKKAFAEGRAAFSDMRMTVLDMVAERWGKFDNLGLLQQLGAVAAPR